jgi:hypothetical protein
MMDILKFFFVLQGEEGNTGWSTFVAQNLVGDSWTQMFLIGTILSIVSSSIGSFLIYKKALKKYERALEFTVYGTPVAVESAQRQFKTDITDCIFFTIIAVICSLSWAYILIAAPYLIAIAAPVTTIVLLMMYVKKLIIKKTFSDSEKSKHITKDGYA